MKLVTREMLESGALPGIDLGQFEPYPGAPRQKADVWIGRPLQWVIEVKMARFFGDNGKPDDTAIKDILSPYPSDRSALTDCRKLATMSVSASARLSAATTPLTATAALSRTRRAGSTATRGSRRWGTRGAMRRASVWTCGYPYRPGAPLADRGAGGAPGRAAIRTAQVRRSRIDARTQGSGRASTRSDMSVCRESRPDPAARRASAERCRTAASGVSYGCQRPRSGRLQGSCASRIRESGFATCAASTAQRRACAGSGG